MKGMTLWVKLYRVLKEQGIPNAPIVTEGLYDEVQRLVSVSLAIRGYDPSDIDIIIQGIMGE